MTNTITNSVIYAPAEDNVSAYRRLDIPYMKISSSKSGPNILLMAGSHGDEYEGQAALRTVMNSFYNKDVKLTCGTVTILPHANLPACEAASRLSPIDKGNFSNSFLNEGGGTTSTIARNVEKLLISQSDIVLDFHSGGHSLYYAPTVMSFVGNEHHKFSEIISLMDCFSVDYLLLKQPWENPSAIFNAAAKHNCIYIASEFAGAAQLDLKMVDKIVRSVHGVFEHLGMTVHKRLNEDDEVVKRWVKVDGMSNRLFASQDGFFGSTLDVNQEVEKGEEAGSIFSFEDDSPSKVFYPVSGFVIAKRPLAYCKKGDCLAEIGRVIPPPVI